MIALRSELKDALAQRDVYHEHLLRAEALLERQRNGAGSPAIARAPIPSPVVKDEGTDHLKPEPSPAAVSGSVNWWESQLMIIFLF